MRRRIPKTALGTTLRHNVASNVRRFRQQRGMTQDQLADAAGLARPFVNRLERGHAGVAVETIGALAMALEISPTQLIQSGD